MYVYSLIFEDGYILDGTVKEFDDLDHIVFDVIYENSVIDNDKFTLVISKLS